MQDGKVIYCVKFSLKEMLFFASFQAYPSVDRDPCEADWRLHCQCVGRQSLGRDAKANGYLESSVLSSEIRGIYTRFIWTQVQVCWRRKLVGKKVGSAYFRINPRSIADKDLPHSTSSPLIKDFSQVTQACVLIYLHWAVLEVEGPNGFIPSPSSLPSSKRICPWLPGHKITDSQENVRA